MSKGGPRSQHPRFARAYLRISEAADLRGVAAHREQLLADLAGPVIEVGAGNGRNFAHYPSTVTSVLAVEPDDTLRAAAEIAARGARMPVTVMAGDADALPADTASLDAAVTSLVLCSVPSPAQALAEIRRVLRPGGQLRFYEHVRSASRMLGLLQDVITPLWSVAGGGCHPNRDTAAAITEAGFVVDIIERFAFSPTRGAPSTAHILGRAHRR